MGKCAIKSCKSRSEKDCKACGLTFHRVPKDQKRIAKWIANIRLLRKETDWLPSSSTTICSKHFRDQDKIPPKHDKGRVRLTDNAVPMVIVVTFFGECLNDVAPLVYISSLIGANTFFIVLFCLGFKLPKFINAHIVLCTVGSQFCMPLAILMINSVHGAAAPLKKSHRRIEHFTLQLLGLAFSVGGGVLAILLGEKSIMFPPKQYSSYHFFSGCAALGLSALTLLSGPCLFLRKAEFSSPSVLTFIHRTFGILAVIASSVCFIFGILKPTMQLWFFILGYTAPTALVVFFTAFVTIVVITTPLTKCCSKKNKGDKC